MVIADSGFWIAALCKRDRWHVRANAAYSEYSESGLITTWPVVAEVRHLLGRFVSEEAKAAFMDAAGAGGFEIHDLTAAAGRHIASLMRLYVNLPMDLADASLVLLAEHLGHGNILTTDRRDFEAYRWKARHPFTNLMFPEA
ncbi:MAG: PIN domain-containing protein [Comamonadaceae bacterium]|nr:PIN domain-containing protein [Comamonadaceae bacterium]